MGTLKKTARLWGFQSPGRPRTEAEHHTKQFLRQLPTRKPAGVIPTAQQTHPYISRRGGAGAGHSAALLSMRSCAPIPSEGRETGPRGRKSRGKKKNNPNHSQHPNKVQPRQVVRLVLCSTQLLCSCQLLSAGERRILIALQSHP